MNWYAIKKEAVLQALESKENGLSSEEAKIRLGKYKKNVIEDVYKVRPVKIFFKQLKSYIVYILLAATLISLAIQHYLDASIIICIVFLNASLGFIQQYKSEKSILELRKLMVPKSKVMRDGKLSIIPSAEIVPGDILIFNEGDHITADCRIINSENLEVNESILTGESLPVEKFPNNVPDSAILAERKNMLFTGTTVVKGNCRTIVVSTGMATEFGKIASSLQEVEIPETPMQIKLNKFAKQISVFVLLMAALIVIVGVLKGQDKFEMLLMSIAIAISAIPEGLPAAITISLAFAAKKMSRNNVITRRLPAAETLGSITIICSDKTGTLTEEKMTAVQIFSNNKMHSKQGPLLLLNGKKVDIMKNNSVYRLVRASVLCNNARFEKTEKIDGKIIEKYEIIGDPTESSLVLSALELGLNKEAVSREEPRIKELSFTSQRKMMSILRKSEKRTILYSKGASSAILHRCASELINGETKKLTNKRQIELLEISEKMEAQALRVLAFAFRNISSKEAGNLEQGLIFLGFIGMQDPPRKEVKSAIEICKNAGIKVKMITGDSTLTAKAISKQISIEGRIVAGAELDEMNDETLKKEIDSIAIFARTDPKQKLRIVKILKEKGEQVAITGDGINDILALKQADIGIAMGQRGSDVAREVSDMILIDDNFASIVKAIEEGRTVYDNIKKITKYQLAVNFSEVIMVLFAIFAGFPLPFLPIQILWMNLITDNIPSLSLIKEKDRSIMNNKPRREKSIFDHILVFLVLAGILVFAVELIIFLLTFNKYPIGKVRTLVVTADIFFELFFIFTCRSDKTLKEIRFFSNPWLVYSVLGMILLQIIAIYSPLNILFSFTPLLFNDWLFILPFSLSGLILFEAGKYIKRKLAKEL